MQRPRERPGCSVIETRAHRHVFAPGARRIGEQNDVLPKRVFCGPHVSLDAGLADGFHEDGVEPLIRPCRAAVRAVRHLARRLGAVIIPHVQKEPPVGQFDDFGFIDLVPRRTAPKGPCCAMIVAVHDMGVVALRFRLDVVACHHQPPGMWTVPDLDAAARAGRIPGPVRLLDLRRDFQGGRPRNPLIRGGLHKDPPRVRAFPVDDLPLVIRTKIPGRKQPDRAGPFIHDGTGIAAGVPAVIPDHLLRRPRTAMINGPAYQQVNVARVAPTHLPALAERQHRAPGRHTHRRNTIRVIPPLPAAPHRLLPDTRRRGPRHTDTTYATQHDRHACLTRHHNTPFRIPRYGAATRYPRVR
jgi:hypothetical protein